MPDTYKLFMNGEDDWSILIIIYSFGLDISDASF